MILLVDYALILVFFSILISFLCYISPRLLVLRKAMSYIIVILSSYLFLGSNTYEDLTLFDASINSSFLIYSILLGYLCSVYLCTNKCENSNIILLKIDLSFLISMLLLWSTNILYFAILSLILSFTSDYTIDKRDRDRDLWEVSDVNSIKKLFYEGISFTILILSTALFILSTDNTSTTIVDIKGHDTYSLSLMLFLFYLLLKLKFIPFFYIRDGHTEEGLFSSFLSLNLVTRVSILFSHIILLQRLISFADMKTQILILNIITIFAIIAIFSHLYDLFTNSDYQLMILNIIKINSIPIILFVTFRSNDFIDKSLALYIFSFAIITSGFYLSLAIMVMNKMRNRSYEIFSILIFVLFLVNIFCVPFTLGFRMKFMLTNLLLDEKSTILTLFISLISYITLLPLINIKSHMDKVNQMEEYKDLSNNLAIHKNKIIITQTVLSAICIFLTFYPKIQSL